MEDTNKIIPIFIKSKQETLKAGMQSSYGTIFLSQIKILSQPGSRWMAWFGFLSLFMGFLAGAVPQEIVKYVLTPPDNMSWAELWVAPFHSLAKAILVLCPRANGCGEGLVKQVCWQEFALKHQLGLVGLSFASDEVLLKKGDGYYNAAQAPVRFWKKVWTKYMGKDYPYFFLVFPVERILRAVFIRQYFHEILWRKNNYRAGISTTWIDLDNGRPINATETPPFFAGCCLRPI